MSNITNIYLLKHTYALNSQNKNKNKQKFFSLFFCPRSESSFQWPLHTNTFEKLKQMHRPLFSKQKNRPDNHRLAWMQVNYLHPIWNLSNNIFPAERIIDKYSFIFFFHSKIKITFLTGHSNIIWPYRFNVSNNNFKNGSRSGFLK